jgi:AraC-like DNA-binding protein
MTDCMNVAVSRLPEPMSAGLFVSAGRGMHPTRVIDSHELIFVRSGRLGVFEESDVFDLHAGQSVLFHAGRKHGGTTNYAPDLSFYWVHFLLPKPSRTKQRMVLPKTATLRRPEVLTELLRRYLDEREAGRLDDVTGGALLLLMFREIERASEQAQATGAGYVLAERAWQYIVAHAHRPISTADVAGHLRCNPDYLGRVFRATRGVSIVEAIHRRRIHEARKMLIDGEMNIEEIASASGFSDACYFRRVFKQSVGMSPRKFRQLYARVHVNVQ